MVETPLEAANSKGLHGVRFDSLRAGLSLRWDDRYGGARALAPRLPLTTGRLRKYKIAIEINRKLAVHTPSTS